MPDSGNERMLTSTDVYAALKPVIDPELGISIVDLGLVYDAEVGGDHGEHVEVTMTFTSPMCPVAPMIKQAVEDAIDQLPGVASKTVDVTFSPPWDPRTMASDDVKLMLGIW